jgi:thioredoxin-dependent peroxiredoxin
MSSSSYPAIGQAAPDFKATVIGGEYAAESQLSLSDLKGHHVVLYFYPKDNTPGCTKQACALRDDWSSIQAKAKVFGVSIDSASSHAKFIKKFDLPFPLIVDEDHAIAEAYGVWVEKSMYGKTYFGTERTSFIIDPAGKLKAVLPKVKPEQHLAQVLAEL